MNYTKQNQTLKKIYALSLLLTVITGTTTIANAHPIHTWHTVSATHGSWQGKLYMINENGHFANREGNQIKDFTVQKDQSFDYGFSFEKGADFDIAYTLTLVEKTSAAFVSKACVYVITAEGPAKPDIRISSFNGAKCDYKIVPGRGEDFIVA